MLTSIVVFDQFTDVDVFLMWDLLNRVKVPHWQVKLLGDRPTQISVTGISLAVHGTLAEANQSDVVLFASGQGTRAKMNDAAWLSHFHLNPEKQLIGSICSGALLLAALGLLDGKEATTYPTAKKALEKFDVTVVEKPFVPQGNIATAGGCLAIQYLVGWVIENKVSREWRELVLKSVQPVGEGMSFDDVALLAPLYTPHTTAAAEAGAQSI